MQNATSGSASTNELRGSISDVARKHEMVVKFAARDGTPRIAGHSLSPNPIPVTSDMGKASMRMIHSQGKRAVLPLRNDCTLDRHRTVPNMHHVQQQRSTQVYDNTFPQCELFKLLLGYLCPELGCCVNEDHVLDYLERSWYESKQKVPITDAEIYEGVLFPWIAGQRATVRSRLLKRPPPQPNSLEAHVQHAQELRSWNDRRAQVFSLQRHLGAEESEAILSRLMVKMTEAWGQEIWFQEALGRLRKRSFSNS